MGDRTRHEWRHVRAFARKLDDGAHDDLRLVGRREADEPSVVWAMRILRRTRLARDRETRDSGAARRALLHHGNHRASQRGQLIRGEVERDILRSGRSLTAGPNDERRPHVAVACELLVQPHHLHEGLRVLALPDREVQRHGGRPAPRAVETIVILRSGRELRGELTRKVDTGASAKSPGVCILQQRRNAKLDAELVEVNVAALRDCLR